MGSFHKLKTEIEGYGYSYSLKNYLKTMITVMILTGSCGVLYQLQPLYYLLILAVCVMTVPAMVRRQFLFLSAQKHFNSIDVYLHQMAFSFQRKPKIQLALWDTLEVADKDLAECLRKAINVIGESTGKNPYQEAFQIVEKEYGCERVRALHQFMLRVEESGGQYQNSLNVLIEDMNHWIERTYQMQKDRKIIKRDSVIGIVLSLFVGAFSVILGFVMKQETIGIRMEITSNQMYQIVTTVFLLFLTGYFIYVQSGYQKDWGEAGIRSDQRIMRDYKIGYEQTTGQIRRKYWYVSASLLAVSLLLCYCGLYLYGCGIAGVFLYSLRMPERNKRIARKRVRHEVQTAFSRWLRNVALNLQYQTLQMAVCDTYEEAPVILKDSLKRFILEIHENPASVTPYYNFCSEFHIMEISSTVKMLYALEDTQLADMDKNINRLIKRNYVLLAKNEQQEDESRLSILRFMEYIPMMAASLKLMLDIVLLLDVAF